MTAPTVTLEAMTIQLRPTSSQIVYLRFDRHDPDHALPVGELRIPWSRSTPWSHAEPQQWQLQLLLAPDAVEWPHIRLDVEVIVRADVRILEHDGSTRVQEVRLASGWISSIEQSPLRSDGRYSVMLTLDDLMTRAAGDIIGDTPWPRQSIAARLQRINELTSRPYVTVSSGFYVAARDIDAQPALDVIQSCCRFGWIVAPDEDGTRLAIQQLPPRGPTDPIIVPPSIIEDTGRAIDRSSYITELGLTAYWALADSEAGTPSTRTFQATTTIPVRSRTTISNDIDWHSTTDWPDRIRVWAFAILAAAAREVPRLPGSPRLVLSKPVPVPNIDRLLAEFGRHTEVLAIPDAPGNLDEQHSILGGEITITGRKIQISLTLAPGNNAGLRNMRWTDVGRPLWVDPWGGTNYPFTFDQLSWEQYPDWTWADTRYYSGIPRI